MSSRRAVRDRLGASRYGRSGMKLAKELVTIYNRHPDDAVELVIAGVLLLLGHDMAPTKVQAIVHGVLSEFANVDCRTDN